MGYTPEERLGQRDPRDIKVEVNEEIYWLPYNEYVLMKTFMDGGTLAHGEANIGRRKRE